MPRLIRQRGGGVEIVEVDGRVTEHETFTCGHCQTIVTVPHRVRAADFGGGVCHGCSRLICAQCAGKGCRPIEVWIEREEARGRMLRDMGLAP